MVALKSWIEAEKSTEAVPFSRPGARPPSAKNRVGNFFSASLDCTGQTTTQVVEGDWELTFSLYDPPRSVSLSQSNYQDGLPKEEWLENYSSLYEEEFSRLTGKSRNFYNHLTNPRASLTARNYANENAGILSEPIVYTGTPHFGPGGALKGGHTAWSIAKKGFGKGFPTKLNRAGKAQPYNPANGEFLSYAKNPGVALSPIGRFTGGFGTGIVEGASPPGIVGPPPVGTVGRVGYMIGYGIGKIGSLISP